VVGIGSHDELAATHRQQMIAPQDAPDLLLSHYEAGALDQRRDPPVSMIAMRQGRSLDGIPQGHFRLAGRLLLPVSIKARPAHRCQLTHALDRQSALRLPAADLGVDAVPPGAPLCRCNPSTLRKALLKKLASKLRRPSSPSRLATWASSSRIFFAWGSSSAAGRPFRAASR